MRSDFRLVWLMQKLLRECVLQNILVGSQPCCSDIDEIFHCSVILYIHVPVHIYGVTYYSTSTTSDVVVAYNTSGPWNLMLSGHAND